MRTNLKIWLTMSLLLVGMVCKAAGQVIYVDDDASLGGNGQTWVTAYKYLQDALNKPPTSGDQIWVAEGIYKPDHDEGGNVTTDDRTATFQLINGVAMYGGFAGTESSLDERDWQTNETILSGDLNGDDAEVSDPCDLLVEPTRAENSYNVVTGSGTDATAVLDGFTITAGNADGSPAASTNVGGGIYSRIGSPTVSNCVFSGNSAAVYGGGMDNSYDSHPTLTNCTFSGNTAGGCGGGMYNNYSNATLANCTFTGNSVGDDGGGISNEGSGPTLTNCTFSENSAGYNGGGMSTQRGGSPTLTNCTFSDNSALNGGGMYNYESSPMLTNCIFSGNWAKYGGGMRNYDSSPALTNCTFSGNSADRDGGGMYNEESSGPTLTNCILWGNTAENHGPQVSLRDSTLSISYCDVQGGQTEVYVSNSTINWGGGNIVTDPLFVRNPDDGGDGWGDDPCTPGEDEGDNDDFGDLHLQAGSPCIDASDNTAVPPDTGDLDGDGNTTERTPLDLDGRPRFVDDPDTTPDTGNGTPPIVDMGAYEFRAPAIIGDFCRADFGPPDGYVDVWDLMQFADQWHSRTGDPNWDAKFDLTGPGFANPDGYVDVWDLMVFADHWHQGQKP